MPSKPNSSAVACRSRSDEPGTSRDWTARRILAVTPTTSMPAARRARLRAGCRRRARAPRRPTRGCPRARSTGRGRTRQRASAATKRFQNSRSWPSPTLRKTHERRADVAVVLEVEHAVDGHVVRVERGVLGVDVMIAGPSVANRLDAGRCPARRGATGRGSRRPCRRSRSAGGAASSGCRRRSPGCISKPSRTPCSVAKPAASRQYGSTTSSHCQVTISVNSGGHAHVTQFGWVAVGPSPGHPENRFTRSTPSSPANRTVSR